MNMGLTQAEFEELTAYLDGELDAAHAARMERLATTHQAWTEALAQLRSLDAAMDGYVAPAPPAGLADRIICRARIERAAQADRPIAIRLLRILAPLAAAAAIILLALAVRHIAHQDRSIAGTAQTPSTQPSADIDNLVVENLDFFKQYETFESLAGNDSVVDDATLKAIDALQSKTAGT